MNACVHHAAEDEGGEGYGAVGQVADGVGQVVAIAARGDDGVAALVNQHDCGRVTRLCRYPGPRRSWRRWWDRDCRTPPLFIVSSVETIRMQTNFPGMETTRHAQSDSNFTNVVQLII